MRPSSGGSQESTTVAEEICEAINASFSEAILDDSSASSSPGDDIASWDAYYAYAEKSLQIILNALTVSFHGTLQIAASGWRYTSEACRHFWEQYGMTWKEVQDKLIDLRVWILHHANRCLEFLVCQRCVLWLHEQTGVRSETLVLVSGASTLGLLLLFVRKLNKRRPRKRRKERSMSLNPADNVRGLRDRGFSLDLSVAPSQSSASRSRGYSFDFWNRNKPAPTIGNENDQHNSSNRTMDLMRTSDIDDKFSQALQHGIGTAGTPNNGNDNNNTATTLQRQPAAVTYYGPTDTKLLYSTFTPPPSWTEASRSLLPTDTRLKLQREIAFDLSKDDCLMTIREPTSSSRQTVLTLPVAQCSVHVKTPVIGGVLQIYVKESTKDEWMEHTFDTAKNAAQFQMDMLAIQIFGPALNRM